MCRRIPQYPQSVWLHGVAGFAEIVSKAMVPAYTTYFADQLICICRTYFEYGMDCKTVLRLHESVKIGQMGEEALNVWQTTANMYASSLGPSRVSPGLPGHMHSNLLARAGRVCEPAHRLLDEILTILTASYFISNARSHAKLLCSGCSSKVTRFRESRNF